MAGAPGFLGLSLTWAPSCLPYKGLMGVSMSRIHGVFKAACTLPSHFLLHPSSPIFTHLVTPAHSLKLAASLASCRFP